MSEDQWLDPYEEKKYREILAFLGLEVDDGENIVAPPLPFVIVEQP